MCNLSTGIEEKATEKTSEKFILNMYKKGYTLDQIADVAETGVDEIKAIVGVYTLLTTEEIFRLVVSLVIFKRRKWMISLS